MKNRFIYASLLVIAIAVNSVHAQDTDTGKKVYSTTGGELIFSLANATQNGQNAPAILRFSPFLNIQNQVHIDMNDHFGFFTGLSIRNVGFIYDDPSAAATRYKVRTYTLGLPLAIKIGNMSGFNLFGGYEFELPFNFKQKTFVNDVKTAKSSDWFSSKTPSLYQSVFVGIQTPYGTQLKFKYYMTNFFNKNYVENVGGVATYPYQNFDANVFYISLSVQILRGSKVSMK